MIVTENAYGIRNGEIVISRCDVVIDKVSADDDAMDRRYDETARARIEEFDARLLAGVTE
jgi:hypothetical protein